MDIVSYTSCPGCGSDHISFVFTAKDHTVTGENFPIWHCAQCTLRFTQHAPGKSSISSYYQSENYISHTDTRKGLINRLYHLVRKRTLEGKRHLVQQTTKIASGRLLDIGAGTGAFLAHMRDGGWDCTGLEPDQQTRARANQLYGHELKDTAQLNSLPPASFDAITLWHVLEHVHDLHEYLDQIRKLLKPSGRAFVAVPNYTSQDAVNYQNFWAAYDVPRHLYHFSPVSMKWIIEKHGMVIFKMQPMWYDSFYVSMLSEQYKNGSGNYIAAFYHGLVSDITAMKDREKCSSLVYIMGGK